MIFLQQKMNMKEALNKEVLLDNKSKDKFSSKTFVSNILQETKKYFQISISILNLSKKLHLSDKVVVENQLFSNYYYDFMNHLLGKSELMEEISNNMIFII
jgi:hypothetical protein